MNLRFGTQGIEKVSLGRMNRWWHFRQLRVFGSDDNEIIEVKWCVLTNVDERIEILVGMNVMCPIEQKTPNRETMRLIVKATQIPWNATMFWLACHVTWKHRLVEKSAWGNRSVAQPIDDSRASLGYDG